MIKKEIKYENYEGEEKVKTAWFHLSVSELAELNVKYDGGLEGAVKKAQAENDNKAILKFFKDLIIMAYGERSEDGESFFKDDYKLGNRFVNSPAYDSLFIEFLGSENADAISEFILGMLPRDVARKVSAANAEKAVENAAN